MNLARVATCLLCIMVVPALAQEGKLPWDEYDKLIDTRQAVATLGPDLFGDNADLDTGALSFSMTDIDIPGNSKLPVALTRKFSVGNRKGYYGLHDLPLADWDLDLPHLSGVFATTWQDQRCGVTTIAAARPPAVQLADKYYLAEDYWQGNHANMPGGGEMLLVSASAPKPTTGGPYYWMTAGQTYFSCLGSIKNGTGQGFLAITSDGTRYWFDWMAQYYVPTLDAKTATGVPIKLARRKNVLYATRVEDRFGNWVTYTYTNAANAPARLTAINANDGRQLTLGYNGNGQVGSVSDGTRSWTYQYSYPAANKGTLTAVVLPDASRWTMAFAALANAEIHYNTSTEPDEVMRSCFNPGTAQEKNTSLTGSITHPSGAVGEFTVMLRRHGRSNVPAVCGEYTTPDNDPNDDVAYYPINWDAWTLIQKRVSGPGVVTATWNYDYSSQVSWFFPSGSLPICTSSGGCAAPRCTSDSCAGTSLTTITGPDNRWMRYTFGNSYRYNEGKLLRVEEGGSASNILRTTTSSYNLAQSGQPYPTPIGTSPQPRGDGFTSEYLRPQQGKVIAQDGVSFSWTVDSGCSGTGIRCFDAYGRATKVTRSSSLGYSKTETTVYHDNLAKWVLGQQARLTVDGIVASETAFNTNAQPTTFKAFGKLQHTLGYHADGTLASYKDGNNNVTTLTSWYRGIPRSIKHPATPEAPTGATESAVVNGNGWITAVTDETGARTCYGYDTMGRIASITWPSEASAGVCDSSTWTPTTQAFAQINVSEYGIPAGHWRQSVSTGNARTHTYYDALWRPLLTETYDQADVNNTLSRTVKHYDANGRLAFQSYPLRLMSDYAAVTQGTRTFYDPLDRVTRVEQDSELGVLATTTEYLSGFQTRVTNPRGFQTTTTLHQAFDEPTYDWPRGINHPEGAYTEIYRDIFGKPTALRRRNGDASQNVWRRYVYDQHQQLCKAIEPETGSTVMNYDAAGNLAWSATGHVLPDTGNCNHAEGYWWGRRVDRIYDARNRQTELRFPDGQGDTVTSYTPDGQPASITAYNGSNIVTRDYTYNKRRLLTVERMLWNTLNWPISYAYNANGHLSQRTIGNIALPYAPNALGQPTQVGGYATGVSYYPNGALKQFTYGNGIVHTLTQNVRGLPERSRDAYGSTAFLDDSYDYDQNGNVAAISDGATGQNQRGNRNMTYDGLDRLTATASPMMFGSGGAIYAYDVLDNLTRVKIGGNVTRDHYYCYDGRNMLTNVKTGGCGGSTVIGLGYDVQGNVANKSGDTFNFDYGNRLRSATMGGVSSSYVYDGHGRRVRDHTGASKYSMYTRDGQLAFVSNLREKKQQWHVYLGGSLVAIRERDTTTGAIAYHYQHTDALGSPVAVTDASRTVVERSEYEPYGKVLNRPLRDRPGYTGHVEDAATGLNYMQQRYYDPQIGRFLSEDPVTAYEKPGENFSRYWYANNNPYKFTDPDGREVRIVIDRDTYTDSSVTSRMTVTSDRTDKSFSGYALEDRRAGPLGNKDPLVEGEYAGFTRTDGSKGFRIELEDTPNFTNVQIHVGNDTDDVMGCFAAGTTRSEDFVGGSKAAMNQIQSVVQADGSGQITVEVNGGNKPPPPPPPSMDPSKEL